MNKVFLIDIDGTICDDIKNEESHLYSTANHFEPALVIIPQGKGRIEKLPNNG
jgi:hypothetical protein